MLASKVFEITGVLQNYAWGKRGAESEVAKLFSSSGNGFVVNPSTTYAELWLGTHPKGPSTIKENGELLNNWLQSHPDVNHQSSELPFLLKVLSVETALSIQIHPNKDEAVLLHAKNPQNYADDNHKPEMAIALTPFEALCGFRPWKEIVQFIKGIEELGRLVSLSDEEVSCSGKPEDDIKLLRTSFTSLMSSNEDSVKRESALWASRIEKDTMLSLDNIHQLFLRLNSQYPGDVGCFCVYFLNYIVLQPGQSIYLESGLPHAYIRGDCVECMACSDNVIRAGLTPKYRDVDSLCSLVNYSCRSISDVQFEPSKHPSDSYVTVYNPPTPEFSVDRIELPNHWSCYELSPLNSPSILLVIEGNFTVDGEQTLKLNRGSTLFIGPNEKLTMKQNEVGSSALMFRAYSFI